MLSIGKLTPGRADYYVEQVHAGHDEYYISDVAEPGYWSGRASGHLGLEGVVNVEDFRAVLEELDVQWPKRCRAASRPSRITLFAVCAACAKALKCTDIS